MLPISKKHENMKFMVEKTQIFGQSAANMVNGPTTIPPNWEMVLGQMEP